MKKTFTRALSLILVLVALLGVMPTAFAKEVKTGATVELNSTSVELAVDGKHQIEVDRMISSYDIDITDANKTFAFGDYNDQIIQVSATGEITALKAGETKLPVTVTATNDDWDYDHVGDVEIAIVVTEGTTPPEGGDTEEHAYSVTVDPAELTLAVDEESEPLDVTVKNGDEVYSSNDYTLSYVVAKVDGNEIASINGDGIVKGIAEGETVVKVTATIKETGDEVTGQTKVTVSNKTKAVIDYERKSGKLTESVKLAPVLKIGGTAVYDAKFKFEKVAMTTTVTSDSLKHSATVKSTVPGVVEIKISVEGYKLKSTDTTYTPGTDIEPIVAYVRFYDTKDMTATIIKGKTKFSLVESKVFSAVTVGGEEDAYGPNLSFQDLLASYLPAKDRERPSDDEKRPYVVYFTGTGSSASGQVEDLFGQSISYKEWAFLDQVNFCQIDTRTGSTTITYKIVDTNGLTMLTGEFSFVITGGEGDIHYETTYNKPIVLKKADFQNFWTEQKLGNQYLLEYVTFDTTGIAGKLYTDSTKKTPVTSAMKFYLQPARGEDALANVYYVPDAKKTTEYTDSINFTVVSNYTATRRVGTLTITLNAKASNITSRGMMMGSNTTSYTEQIAAAYKENTGTVLGYVIFDLPEAKYGKLYSQLPAVGSNTKVAQGVLLDKDEPLYYSPAKITELPLKDAAFVPAAGFSGEVELTYTAYDKYGYSEYKGILRLNVTKKTASGVFADVNAKNYSWAADSVDFLYYEGTAQGSNGKYNPKANITRRDFMLMLYRAFLADDYKTFNVTSNFPDVVKGTDAYSQEIYQAVGVAKYLGIAQGSNDKFNPKDNITRQEAMVLIYRTLDVIRKDLDYTVTTNIASFKDANKISSWATTAIAYLVNHGVIQGTNDMVNPLANITRAEMACILHRVLTY